MKAKHLILSAVLITALVSCNNEATEEVANEAATETTAESTNEDHGQAGVAAVEGEDPNALQLAMSMDDFSTLVVAVKAAGVQDALVNAGPLTVFAPLNTAFDKLPEGTVETLLKPESKADLSFILVNHVAPANYPMKQLKKEAKKGRKLYMASGKYLEVEYKDGKVFVGGTEVLQSVKVSNGWVHVIDDVLVPAE
ncbi:MAG TPA: fasciclin domain-containing protein [Crocinitomicaceae bacterium]|nr:fasciclin domain-containing protein [Crocinitomicaceae bacterium]